MSLLTASLVMIVVLLVVFALLSRTRTGEAVLDEQLQPQEPKGENDPGERARDPHEDDAAVSVREGAQQAARERLRPGEGP